MDVLLLLLLPDGYLKFEKRLAFTKQNRAKNKNDHAGLTRETSSLRFGCKIAICLDLCTLQISKSATPTGLFTPKTSKGFISSVPTYYDGE